MLKQLLLEKIDTSYNNPVESSTTKINKMCVYSLFTHCSFDTTKNKHHYYRDYMKNLRKDLRDHAIELINHKNK